jgi:molybdenum cofactor biosynthesis protein B
MATIPHSHQRQISVSCGIITLSDTRNQDTDLSGKILTAGLENAGHRVNFYQIIPDEPEQIITLVRELSKRSDMQVIITNGGTGIAPRDTTFDALSGLLEKTLPGFGEIFRYLSYQEIGSRAIASRAVAGVYQNKLIFSLPGSSKAVKLALDQLILPELVHLTQQIRG